MNQDKRPVIVVTGTSRGLGFDIAQYFLAKDCIVVGCSRGPGVISHVNYSHHSLDLCSEKSVQTWVRLLKRQFSRIEIVICNVGLVRLGSLTASTSLDSFASFMDSILVSTFLVCREFSKLMVMHKYGRIINITSIMSELNVQGTCGYATAKKAVVAFTKILAAEVAEYGVTCNVVSPSLIDTESSRAFGDTWRKKMLDLQSIKRDVSADEICRIIEFLASPNSGCLTGQVLHTCFID